MRRPLTVGKALAGMVWIALALEASAANLPVPVEGDTSSIARIESDFSAEHGACGFFTDNAREVCRVDATGRMRVARARLTVQLDPSAEANRRLRIAVADAEFAAANQRCIDKQGRERSLCLDAAKARDGSARTKARLMRHEAASNR